LIWVIHGRPRTSIASNYLVGGVHRGPWKSVIVWWLGCQLGCQIASPRDVAGDPFGKPNRTAGARAEERERRGSSVLG